MNPGAKVVIGVGVVIVLVGIALLVYAGPYSNPSNFKPEEYTVWRGSSTTNETLDLDDGISYTIYVKGGGGVNNFSITSSGGVELFTQIDTIHMGSQPEWQRIGYVDEELLDCPCSMNFTANAEVIIVDNTPKFGDSETWCTFFGIGCLTFLAGLVTTAGGGGWALLSKKGSAVQMQTIQQQAIAQTPSIPPDQQSS